MFHLARDLNRIGWVVVAIGLCVVTASKHPDCLDPTRGQRTFEVCGWKFHRAVTNFDIALHGNNSCIPCYTNACFQPNSERCRTECPKYWSLCLNYTDSDSAQSSNPVNKIERTEIQRLVYDSVNASFNTETIILAAFATFLVVGAVGFGIYKWKADKEAAAKERYIYHAPPGLSKT